MPGPASKRLDRWAIDFDNDDLVLRRLRAAHMKFLVRKETGEGSKARENFLAKEGTIQFRFGSPKEDQVSKGAEKHERHLEQPKFLLHDASLKVRAHHGARPKA